MGYLVYSVVGLLIVILVLRLASSLWMQIESLWIGTSIRIQHWWRAAFNSPPKPIELAPPPAPPPLDFTPYRTSHMHVVGGSGAGKTQLLQGILLGDILVAEPRPALVVVDSQGDLISKLSHLEIFHPENGVYPDKLIIIDPRDHPALNIFDVNRSRFQKYDEHTKEQITAGVIETFDYLFSGIIGADLTTKQSVFFRYLARLMLHIPESLGRNATILDLLHLMDNPDPYRSAIQSLPSLQRNFFERDFSSKGFAQTREQIRYRLHALLENPTLERLFNAPQNKLDLFRELNEGSIILVDTAKDFLKGSSAHFGRIFISLFLQAVQERAAMPEGKRPRAYLIVDEAAEYFDQNIDDLLTTARKYNVGCTFAHQFLDQCTPALRASLSANCSIKLAGSVSASDARVLAPDFRTTADFILAQKSLRFACYVRGMTEMAISVQTLYGELESCPRMDDAAYRELRARNRQRVSRPLSREAPPSSITKPTPQTLPSIQTPPPPPLQPQPSPPRDVDNPSISPSTDW